MSDERRRFRSSGGELSYLDVGEGSPVLLLHGFPTSSLLWRREAALLSARMRVLAPDLLGYGESDRSVTADLSPVAQARYVRELLADLAITELAVVGHDIGGAVAMLLALEGGVKTMVLLDTACFDAWPVDPVRGLQRVTPEEETPARMEESVRLVFDRGMMRERPLAESMLRSFLDPWASEPDAFFRAARGIDGRGLAGRERELSSLSSSTFIVWGEEDPFLPKDLGERLGETIPGSTVALLPGCSHFVSLDAPETVGPMVFEYLRYRYLGESHRHASSEPVPVFLERPGDRFLEPDPKEAEG
ncbi:MAG: alpha/beta hydrolase [Actinobacteria bacterium]|nr:alpha/beta hydrolase [Actinomycetota bacterium]